MIKFALSPYNPYNIGVLADYDEPVLLLYKEFDDEDILLHFVVAVYSHEKENPCSSNCQFHCDVLIR